MKRAIVLIFLSLSLSACASADPYSAEDTCSKVQYSIYEEQMLTRMAGCEAVRAQSVRNELLADYRKCVDLHTDDPTVCSGIMQGLNAASVNVGPNRTAR